MSMKERVDLFDTTLDGPSARSREAREDGQVSGPGARHGGAA